MSDDPLDSAKKVTEVVAELVRAAGDSPEVQATGRNLGKAALTISQTINVALLPLAALNFGVEKAREYFATRFQNELIETMKNVPPEHVVTPKASLAGPALQGLAFAHDEPSLKSMYLELLAVAMDGRRAHTAHPGYVEIIRQLDSREVLHLQKLLRVQNSPLAELRSEDGPNGLGGWIVLHRHLSNEFDDPVSLSDGDVTAAMIDNWVRLGLATVDYDTFIDVPGMYDWVKARPEYIAHEKEQSHKGRRISYVKGLVRTTSYGAVFGKIVGEIVPSDH